MNRFSILLAIATVVALTAIVPSALAQDPLTDPSSAQYGSNIPGDDSSSASASESTGLNSRIGQLPFTGLDLLIVAGVSFVLTGTGFALRRLSAPRGPYA